MTTTKKIKYNNKHRLGLVTQIINFGLYKEKEYDKENNEAEVEIVKTVDEFTFYFLYCSIMNITAQVKLAESQIILLSAIMAKPLDFTLPVDSKDGKLTAIANELSTEDDVKTPNSIYQSVKRLKDRGYLTETEDRLIVPSIKLQEVRQAIKKQIEEKGFATFDYLFKCVIQ